jgi:hypothetical protein
MQETIHSRTAPMAWRRMNDQASGLIDHHHLLV